MIESWKLVSLTYNVNKQRPTRESVQNWLQSEELGDAQIVTFAMQEVPHAEVFKATPTHNTWSEQLTFWMAQHQFSLVNKLCLASNMLLVYFKLELLQFIDNVDDRWCRSSLLGTVGYKGTIATRVKLRTGAVLIFITSHLFADEKHNRERIKQYQQSLYCTFPEDCSTRKFIIWQGDLNFRVEGFANSAQFIAILNNLEDIDELGRIVQRHDQLQKSKQKGEIFADFREATIRFKPSYRILVGSGSFDPLRIPSWCDRILYRTTATSQDLTLSKYSSCRTITLSDHFPVSAQFSFHPGAALAATAWTCTFEHIPQWEELIPLVCHLTIPIEFWNQHGSNLDWVGVYPQNMEMISRPILWVYLLTCPVDEQRRIMVELQPLEPGHYRVGYFCSGKKCLQALSNPFTVRRVQERNSYEN